MRTIYIFGAVIVFGFNLLYLYPEYYEKLMITFSYNCIYCYSMFQSYYTKLNKLLTFCWNDPYDIEFIKNGEVVYKTYKHNLHLLKAVPSFDFIIYSDNKLIPVNKVIYNSIPSEFTYTIPNFKFIIVNFIQNNKVVQLNLSNGKHNYYIVNNVLNEKFLLYFLKNIENHKIQGKDYKLQIMDHNIIEFELLPTECVIFNTDDYITQSSE